MEIIITTMTMLLKTKQLSQAVAKCWQADGRRLHSILAIVASLQPWALSGRWRGRGQRGSVAPRFLSLHFLVGVSFPPIFFRCAAAVPAW